MNNKLKITIVMKKLSLLLVVISNFILLITGCTDGTSKSEEKFIVFEDVDIIDAVNGLRPGQTVVVKGNKILDLGKSGEIKVPSGSTIIKCSGKFMIPGLWDAHVHITNSEALKPIQNRLFIINGITYIRDTGATLQLILPMRKSAETESKSGGLAPEIFMTGPHLDGLQLSWESSVSAATPAQVRFIIDCLENAGVNEIKVYDLIPYDACMEVFSYAKSKGFRISSHIPLSLDVVEASNAGLSSMEHMYNLEMSCSSDWDSLLTARRKMIAEGSAKPGGVLRNEIYTAQRLHAFRTQSESRRDSVLKTLAKNQTWQVPTLAIIAQEEHRMFTRKDWMQNYRYLPESVRIDWEKTISAKINIQPSEEGMAHALWAYDMVPRIAGYGIGIMAGTDMPLEQLTPGFSLHLELELLVKAGLTPLQAIEAATLNPAKYYRIEDRQGTINKGMLADLVILDANPLENISNTQSIWAVMRNGFLHNRDKLNKIQQDLEKGL